MIGAQNTLLAVIVEDLSLGLHVVLIEDPVAITWSLVFLVDVEVFFNASLVCGHEVDPWFLVFRVSRIIILVERPSIWQLLPELTTSSGLSQLVKLLDKLGRHLELLSLDYHLGVSGFHSIVQIAQNKGVVSV